MRIIIVSSSDNRSGGTRQAVYQFFQMSRQGHDVWLCLPKQSAMFELIPPSFSQVVKMPEDYSLWRKIIENLAFCDAKACVIHAYHNKALKLVSFWGLLWKIQGRKAVCVAHRGVIYRPGNPLPYLSPGLQAVFPNSYACAKSLFWHCPASKIHVVQNGIPDERITPTRLPALVREELGLTDEFLFICVGNDNPAKGGDVLLKAFAKLNISKARLLMIGFTFAKWQGLCQELGIASQTIFIDKTEAVSDYLQIAQVFVFPSRDMDSAPNTLLEALCMGLPLVACKVGGVPELVQENGLLTPVGDVNSLALALQQVYDDKSGLLGFAEQSRLLAGKYSIEQRCKVLEQQYQNLIAKLR